jgi:hypothetical protein
VVQGGIFRSITPGDLDFNRGMFKYVKEKNQFAPNNAYINEGNLLPFSHDLVDAVELLPHPLNMKWHCSRRAKKIKIWNSRRRLNQELKVYCVCLFLKVIYILQMNEKIGKW